MSELKATSSGEIRARDALLGYWWYEKSKADKVIAELKKVCKDKDDWCLHTLKELRHHKYKRCVTMAKWCDEAMMSCELRGYTVHRIWANKHQWAMRWKYRWLELAEKFKPNN